MATRADTFELASVYVGAELERGPHHQVLETIAEYRDRTGQTIRQTNSITVLATGLSYFDQGQWQATREQIEVLDTVAVARHGPHKVVWPAELGTGTSIEVVTADGQRFVSQVLGLSYYDAATGASVLIAESKPSRAELGAPNKLVYSDAFDGVKADLVYEYRCGSVAQEVVLNEQLPDPREFGLDPETTRFEVVTEFLEAPEPVVERTVVRAETEPARRALMAEPELTDDRLEFGVYATGPGKAFSIGDGAGGQRELFVAKRWEVIKGRKVLFEQVEWNGLEPLVAELPKQANAVGMQGRTMHAATFERALPETRTAARTTALDSSEAKGRLVASADSLLVKHSNGVVIDWELVQSQANFTFKGDTTYLVMGPVNLTGTTTVEGGTVVKYTNAVASPKVSITGTIKCNTGPYRPAFFTAKDDNTVGEIIPGSSGSPSGYYYGNPAVEVRTSGQVLEELRVRYAQTGLFFYDYSAGTANQVRHTQLVGCNKAIQANGYGVYFQNLALRNVLIHGVQTALYGYSFAATAEHLTVHQCTQLTLDYNGQVYGTTSSLLVTNSVLAEVEGLYAGRPVTVSGSYNGFWPGPGFGSPKWTAPSDPFRTVGAGAHYLQRDSLFIDKGTTAINQDLLVALGDRTTQPPFEWATDFTSDTTLFPAVARDSTAPDLGWHYAPLDYLWSNLNLTGATVVLTNGVAVGVGGVGGLRLQNGATMLSEGSPLRLNRLARYEMVQEQPVVLGGSGSSISMFTVNGMPPVLPRLCMRFTEISFPAGSWGKRLLLDNYYTYGLEKLELRDCQVHGAALNISLYPLGDSRVMMVGMTNNIFSRVWFNLDQDTDVPRLVVHLRNNLFVGGWLKVADYMGTGTWSARDNLFDQTSLTDWSGVPNSHNGYTAASPLPGSGDGNVLNLVPDYLTGTLGGYYYPSSGPQLARLINVGSRSAAEAGLYHYTVKTSNVKEGAETPPTVDIGFHYVACANFVPIDTDGDGLADYCEDKNGNGVLDVGETKLDDPDSDYDGQSDAEEVYELYDPLDDKRFPARRLAYWRFNDVTQPWRGAEGEEPIQVYNVGLVDGFDGKALRVNSASPANLRYRDIEADGKANICPKGGSVRFWFKPEWNSGAGPGTWARLLEMGDENAPSGWWCLYFNPTGTEIIFSTKANGVKTNYVHFPISWTAGDWHEIRLVYRYNFTQLWVDKVANDPLCGGGLVSWPDRAVCAQYGLNIASDKDGNNQAKGCFDELEIYNYTVQACEYLLDPAMISAAVVSSPPAITIYWTNNPTPLSPMPLKIERRVLDSGSWTTLTESATGWSYTDIGVELGQPYEYKITSVRPERLEPLVSVVDGTAPVNRGRVILLVETNLASDALFTSALAQFERDLVGDGWRVLRHTAPRHIDSAWDADPQHPNPQYVTDRNFIKDLILQDYSAAPTETKAVIIVGHVTVPISGWDNPDYHGSRALPADPYYGDVDGIWTDLYSFGVAIIDRQQSPEGRHHNYPGDGKFDQSAVPNNANGETRLELAVGRIDFARLSAFGTPADGSYSSRERDLVMQYLWKAHMHRHKQVTYRPVVVRFPFMGVCPLDSRICSYASRIASRCFGMQEGSGTIPGDIFFQRLPVLFGMQCGHGQSKGICYDYVPAGGKTEPVHHTSMEIADGTLEPAVAFSVLIGSYFLDWGYENNLMRALVAAPKYTLATVHGFAYGWTETALWRFEGAAMGEPVGLTMPRIITYANGGVCPAYAAFLGDPTLRIEFPAPPQAVTVSANAQQITLTWVDSFEQSPAYVVDLSTNGLSGSFVRLTPTPITGTSFVHQSPPAGQKTYRVHTVCRTVSGSGTYDNLSQGVLVSID